jgi:glycosyltransferase involved in cell wall biosynthesis
LIDDGSRDGSDQVCCEYAEKDKRVRYVRFEENSGLPARRYNDGMRLATSPYFMYMFDDDFWYPHAMKTMHEAIMGKHSRCGMAYGLADYVDENSGVKKMGFGEHWNMVVLAKKNILGNLSVIVPRRTINSVGGYDEDVLFRRWCDWDLWLRIGAKFLVGRVPLSVGCVVHSSSDSVFKMVKLRDEDKVRIRKIQAMANRRVRLQGEL